MGSNGLDPHSARSASCPRELQNCSTTTSPPLCLEATTQLQRTVLPRQLIATIPPRILKECAHQFAPSLCLLFSQSLQNGSIPQEWKLANIIPIHKKGDISDVENYRPISLLSVISKVLERCVLRKLRDHLMSLINSTQHSFIPGRLCTTQLVEVLHYIGSILDSGKQTDMIFMDMSKAFDKVSHTALINKLRKYNIGGSLLQWFTSYLHDRQQRVTTLIST